jgi:hypothetical protein
MSDPESVASLRARLQDLAQRSDRYRADACGLSVGETGELSKLLRAAAERLATLEQELDELKSRKPPCGDGWHHGEALSPTHRRCIKCGLEWDIPSIHMVPPPEASRA